MKHFYTRSKAAFFIFLVAFSLPLSRLQAQTIRYVKQTATGTGNGSSWANASNDLQAMIDYVASNGTGTKEVWVAAGTFKPTKNLSGSANPTNPREKTFYLNGVSIYGGFAGTETALTERTKVVIAANVTTLSGDFNDNDVITGGGSTLSITNNTENAYHVVYVGGSVSSSIDGFTIKGGNANGYEAFQWSGGGIAGGTYIRNNTILGNSARVSGGGIYGGAVITNNTISRNFSIDGGGIYGGSSISNNAIVENFASNEGGGIRSGGEITNNIFLKNSGKQGGGIYAGALITNNTFVENTVTPGGVRYYNTFIDGGVIYGGGTPTNNIFWNNAKDFSNPLIWNLRTLTYDEPASTFKNNLFKNPQTYYSATDDGPNAIGSAASGNIFDKNPGFINQADPDGADNIFGTADDGLQLADCSFAANVGLGTGTLGTRKDMLGNPVYGIKDMGAYERQSNITPPTILHVNASVTSGTGDGSSWANAYRSLSIALATANNCSNVTTIKVAAGTYKPTEVFWVRGGLTLYGGFSAIAPEATLEARKITTNQTILSGDLNDNDVVTGSGKTLSITGNSENAYTIVQSSGTGITIDGFTVKGGTSGGISLSGGTNIITNNTIWGNVTNGGGAGINISNVTNNTITNNTIWGNLATGTPNEFNTYYGSGGGIATTSTHGTNTNTISNNVIWGNRTENNGSGIFISGGTSTISNNTITRNYGEIGGGGITAFGAATITNNIYAGNNHKTYVVGSNNLPSDKNPDFINADDIDGPDNIHRTADDGLQLGECSEAVNTGTNAGVPTTDILGNAIYGVKDIGAYERQATAYSIQTLYVNAAVSGGTGDGTSWANAYASLSGALAKAHYCTSIKAIKVAAGTYKPTKKAFDAGQEVLLDTSGVPLSARYNTFHIPQGVTIEGGYNAISGNRDINANVTILSGDFNGDDVISGSGSTLSITGNVENAYHVVFSASYTYDQNLRVTIDGFTIKGGNANGPSQIRFLRDFPLDVGGSVLIDLSVSTLSNNTIMGNNAISGGGIYSSGNFSTSTLKNNIIIRNSATNGGGVYLFSQQTVLSNNTISENNAGSNGGGIYSNISINTISNNTISGNNAGSNGGGFYNFVPNISGSLTNTLSNNIFWDNKKGANATVVGADYYADYYIEGSSINTFKNNLLQLAGSNYSVSSTGNYAIGAAATDNIFGEDPNFVNATDIDGADNIYRTADDGLQLGSCSLAIDGGLNTGVPTTDILGNAVYNSLKDIGAYERQSANSFSTKFAVTGSGDYCYAAVITNVAVGLVGSEIGVTYQLKNAFGANIGAAISGTGAALTFGNQIVGTYTVLATRASDGCKTIMSGKAVVTTSICCPSSPTLYVNASVSGGTSAGTSWANALVSLSDALFIAHSCSIVKTIRVAAGTYKPTKKPIVAGAEIVTSDDRFRTFHIPDGVAIEGGYDAATGNRLPFFGGAGGGSILSGDFNGDDVVTGSGSGLSITGNTENAYHVVVASANKNTGVGVTVNGFTIKSGNANNTYVGLAAAYELNGNYVLGAIGGGIFTLYGTNTLSNNFLLNNNSVGRLNYSGGGGICVERGTNTLSNNTLVGNTTGAYGGGISCLYGTNTLSNNTLLGNSAIDGGGVYFGGTTNTLSNNTFSGNSANNGGGIFTLSSTSILTNNTLSGNVSTADGGGIYISDGTNTLTNNIFWDNKKGSTPSTAVVGADYYRLSGTNTFKNNLLQLTSNNYTTTGSGNYDLGTAATGNVFERNPTFVNAADPDGADNIHRTADDGLQLDGCSVVIDAGTNTGTPTTDILGNGIYNSLKDIGAYERQSGKSTGCCPSGPTLYVNASVSGGTGDGITWANAYASLANVLTVAHSCTAIKTIRVAAGTYKPTKKPFNAGVEITTSDDRDKTFHIPDGVTIEGGYNATTGSRLSGFGGATTGSILSGDFNGNDVVTGSGSTLAMTGNTENAYHVVLASANSSTGTGATVNGFTVKGGNANNANNTSIALNGNNIFRNSGGGITVSKGTNTLTNNILLGNAATNFGGAINTIDGTNMLTNNILSGNSATNSGGAISTSNGSNTLNNNALSGNKASSEGGGIYTSNGTNTLRNNTFSGNVATTQGGGIYTANGVNTLTNNIFWDNKKGSTPSATVVGADYYRNSSTNTFKNNILQLALTNYSTTGSGNYDLGTTAAGNIFELNPGFVNAADPDGADNIYRTADDGLQLGDCSGAINAGTSTDAPTTDILGNAIYNSLKDMGAYERQSAKSLACCPSNTTILYVNTSVSGGTGEGTSWANAYNNLSDALLLAHNCSIIKTIRVAAGTYKPTKKPIVAGAEVTTSDDRDKTFHIPDGIAIEGGYNAATGNRLPNFGGAAAGSILSGDFNGDDVITGSGNSLSITNNAENAYHVVLSFSTNTSSVTVNGFTIKGGNASGSVDLNGIGKYIGGGIFVAQQTNTLSNNILLGNSANSEGGGIYAQGGINTLTNNTLSSNQGYYGGGIYTVGVNILTNNTLSGNQGYEGGGIYIYGVNTLTNNTLSGNSAFNGGGVYSFMESLSNTLKNNIFWGNIADSEGVDYYDITSTTFINNLLQLVSSNYGLGADASGNIFAQNPNFLNATDLDGADNVLRTADDGLTLQAASPCINTGTATGAPTTDIRGTTRPQDGGIDMGAYERSSAVLPVELLSFSGKNTEGGNLLTWRTANEVNNKGFQVERLNGLGNWDNIGFKTANNKGSTYEFTDKAPLPTSYYRLRQIDNDGTTTYSKIVSVVQTGKGKGLKVYPNPVANTLTLENTEGGNFQIINLLGQQVLTGKTAQQLDVSALPKGTYVLKVGTEQAKFIKQ